MLLTTDIRTALPTDAHDLARVHEASWREAYAGILPPKALNAFIARRDVAWWVRTARHADMLVLEAAGRAVGYATMGRNRTGALPQAGEIYEIYLAPEYQGVGMGRELFDAARMRLCERLGAGLVVWAIEENERAMRFYAGQGGRDVAEGTERFHRRILNKVAWAFD